MLVLKHQMFVFVKSHIFFIVLHFIFIVGKLNVMSLVKLTWPQSLFLEDHT